MLNLSSSHRRKDGWVIHVLHPRLRPASMQQKLERGDVNELRSGPLKFSATQGRPSYKSEIRRGGRRCTVEPLD